MTDELGLLRGHLHLLAEGNEGLDVLLLDSLLDGSPCLDHHVVEDLACSLVTLEVCTDDPSEVPSEYLVHLAP